MKNKLSYILLLIGLIFSTGVFSQEKTFKILSYNVYWGMKEDTTANKSKFAEWIKAQDADVVALQEMNGFTVLLPMIPILFLLVRAIKIIWQSWHVATGIPIAIS